MTIPAVFRLGVTLHNDVREVAAEFGRFILSHHKWMQKERERETGLLLFSYRTARPILRMEKAAVPEFYRHAMFEPEFLTTVWFVFLFGMLCVVTV